MQRLTCRVVQAQQDVGILHPVGRAPSFHGLEKRSGEFAMDDDADARSSGYTQSVEEADWQHIEDVGLGLASEGTEHDDQAESKDLPFRAIDLL